MWTPLVVQLAVVGALLAGCADKYPYGRPPASMADQTNGGCALSAAGGLAFPDQFDTRGTSGDPLLDAAILQESYLLTDAFGVWPGLTYFVEPPGSGPNAYATPARLFRPDQHGTVLLGMRLLMAERHEPNWGAALNGIMAHEWAHIVQQNREPLRIMPVPWKELHADFLAGWYLGLRSRQIAMPIDGFGRSLYGKGDTAFFDPNHHGTPAQRATMMFEGYVYARETGERSIDAALARGASHLRFRGNFIEVIASR